MTSTPAAPPLSGAPPGRDAAPMAPAAPRPTAAPAPTFVERHPVLAYYLLAFTVSWVGSTLVVGGPGGLPTTPEQHQRLFPAMLLALFAGPTGAGLLLTGVVGGRAGFRDLLGGLLAWRVGAGWYAVALLTAPLVMAATIFPLALASPVFLPRIVTADDKAPLLLGALAVGSVTGLLEELGWTGFAVPRLRRRYGVLVTGLIAGFLWGAWHYISVFWGSGTPSGGVSLSILLPTFAFYVAVLPLFRVLMVWVYDRTGSLLVAVLMHAGLTGPVFFIFMPQDTSVETLVTWYLVMTAALWIAVAAVAAADGGKLKREPLAPPHRSSASP